MNYSWMGTAFGYASSASARLWLSRSTVKLHLSNVYRKLEVGNRVELARLSR